MASRITRTSGHSGSFFQGPGLTDMCITATFLPREIGGAHATQIGGNFESNFID
jgi:hypothetical protein